MTYIWIIVIHMLVFHDETVPALGNDFAFKTERACKINVAQIAERVDYRVECRKVKLVSH